MIFLEGGRKNNKLFGGSGDDLFYGGLGKDILKGRAWSDTFIYKKVKGCILNNKKGLEKVD